MDEAVSSGVIISPSNGRLLVADSKRLESLDSSTKIVADSIGAEGKDGPRGDGLTAGDSSILLTVLIICLQD